ncbi:MAG: EAL domain-containing protein [Betaproteobacteria bacterium]
MLRLLRLAQRLLRRALPIAVIALLGALVAATLYWTAFDARWTTFLYGVLIAAVLASASRTSRAEWSTARRTRQLARAQLRLEDETARGRVTTEALKAAELRLRVIGDALPQPIFFIDSGERCRFINRDAAQKLSLPADEVEGQLLRDMLSGEVYNELKPFVVEALAGASSSCDLAWDETPYGVRNIPYAQGVCMMFSNSIVSKPSPEASSPDSAQSLYLSELAGNKPDWVDPKEKLELALRENQFLLLQQRIDPLCAIKPEPICEILLRLKEEDELLPPGGFFPIAERYGMMEALGRWVVSALIAHCNERQAAEPGWQTPIFCVNVSTAALLDSEFAEFAARQVTQRKFNAPALCLEIAEPDIIERHRAVHDFMSRLKPLGCRFTADAFGSVKASFVPLAGLPFDFLKIDGIITQNLLRDPSERLKVQAIGKVCRKLGIHSIAEFVENEELRQALWRLDIDYVQGFGIARPMALGELP